mmetsp:Transcript_24332/g.79445  ORF Transcript_24332/g.79445 Transcript_24332/m.79445 type:complete len:93 (+) Transcript_24332:1830-2108(+)
MQPEPSTVLSISDMRTTTYGARMDPTRAAWLPIAVVKDLAPVGKISGDHIHTNEKAPEAKIFPTSANSNLPPFRGYDQETRQKNAAKSVRLI